jgi:hypothetical protein
VILRRSGVLLCLKCAYAGSDARAGTVEQHPVALDYLDRGAHHARHFEHGDAERRQSQLGGTITNMIDAITHDDERALVDVRTRLLRDRPLALRPDQGNEAFRQHKVLASAVHHASRLNRRKADSETEAWERYFTDYFPPGRNDRNDARLLFGEWRTCLLKDDTPGERILVSHGQSGGHCEEREELARLRDENARLRMEREILSKAAVFFAKESDGR